MDTRINLALVGFGKFGKKYFKNIKQNKNFILKTIFRKKKIIGNKLNKISKKNINQLGIHAAIICTPVDTHFRIAKFFIENRIPVILEKPAAKNLIQIKKLILLSKKNKTSVLVNHSDLFNHNFNSILSKINMIGKIRLIEIDFGKYSKNYKDKNLLPWFDWFPHPLAIIIKLLNNVRFVKVKKNVVFKKNKSFFQNISIYLKGSRNIDIKINYSNQSKKKSRNVKIYGNKGFANYDGYNNKNNFLYTNRKIKFQKTNLTPLQNILSKFYTLVSKRRFQSDLKLSFEIEKIQSMIRKKI